MNAPLSFETHAELIFIPPLLAVREEPGPGYGRDRNGSPEVIEDWRQVHARFVELGAERAGHEREVCRWLLAAERLGVPTRVGYASLEEYAERIVGLNGRQTEERLRVGRALAGLPGLDAALANGALCWSVVRELSRVATGETEEAWLSWAKGRRSREVERAVASHHRGDGPDDRGDPSLLRHKLRFEVRAETMALFRDAQAAVRAQLGGDVDDDMLLYEIARRVLGGPGDEGRASYQVAVTRCESCGQTSIDAGGQSHPVDDAVAEMAACDGQHLGRVGRPGPHVGAEPSEGENRREGGRPHVGAPSPKRARAAQTIPPVVRREVMRRDRRRCVVPGCQNHVFLDVHHLDPRAEGGGHDPERLAVLCGAHHRSVHWGHLCIEGTASEGFSVYHGDGTPYGQMFSPPRLDLTNLALGALQNMGFKATQARKLVDAVLRMEVVPEDPGAFVRAALRASS